MSNPLTVEQTKQLLYRALYELNEVLAISQYDMPPLLHDRPVTTDDIVKMSKALMLVMDTAEGKQLLETALNGVWESNE